MEVSPIEKELNHTEECPIKDERSHRRAKRSRNVEMEIDNLYKAVPQLHKVFNVIDKIGEGTFSAVYLGEAKMLDGGRERFALKRLIPTSHPARIAAELQCLTIAGGRENVMGATYCFRREGEVVIVMPYMEHQPIGEIIGLLSFEEVRLYIYNLLKALKHIHQFGIIHRDIKFNNFLYNRRAKMYSLVDFGLAQGTADTQIELLKVVKQRATQKAGGATGKTDTGVPGKKGPRAPDTPTPLTTTGPPSPPQPQQQSAAPPSSSSSSTTATVTPTTATSSPSTGKQVARPATTTTTTTSTTSKHTKLSRLSRTLRPVFGERNLNSVPSAPTAPTTITTTTTATTKPPAARIELVKPGRTEDLVTRRVAPPPPPRKPFPARSLPRTSTVSPALTCHCFQTERVCNICMSRKKQVAPRAGTPGFRAPEVLTCCPTQGTAVSGQLVKPGRTENLVTRRVAPPPPPRKPFPARSLPRTSTVSPALTCHCFQTERVCNICMSRKKQVAPRAGTPGFRAPEVLTCCPTQGTAIDVWSAGVILLSLLSNRYPFFKGSEDLVSLTQIMIVRGSRETVQAAQTFGKAVVCSRELPRQDLRLLCERLRGHRPAPDGDEARLGEGKEDQEEGPRPSGVAAAPPAEGPRPPAPVNDHHLPIKKQHRRLECTAGVPAPKAPRLEGAEGVRAEEEEERGWDRVPGEAYGLLDRLLDLNPATRITAAEALLHPLFTDLH